MLSITVRMDFERPNVFSFDLLAQDIWIKNRFCVHPGGKGKVKRHQIYVINVINLKNCCKDKKFKAHAHSKLSKFE